MAKQLHPPVTTLDVTDGVTTVTDVKEIDVTGASVADGGNGQAQLTIAGSQVKVTTNDTTPDFLSNKVTAGAGISLNILNPAGDEELEIVAAGGGGSLNAFNGTTKPIYPADTELLQIPFAALSAGVLSDAETDKDTQLTFYSQYDITTPASGANDAFFQDVLIYLDGEGADEDTTISDLSLVGNTVTFTGGAKLDDAATKFNATTSFYFPGTGTDSIRIPATNTLYDLRSGNFTIEFFFRREGAGGSNARIFATRDGATIAGLLIEDDAGVIKFSASSDGLSYDYANGVTIIASPTLNEWYHIAIERNRRVNSYSLDSLNVYVDGVLAHSVTLDPFSIDVLYFDPGGSARWTLGGSSITSNSLNGRIEQFRTSLGNARYWSNFSVPKSAFGTALDDTHDPFESQVFFYHPGEGTNGQASIPDITSLQLTTTLNGGMTLSNSQTKFNATTSIQFDGTDDYYVVDSSSDGFLEFSAPDVAWTFDCWVRFDATGNAETIVGNYRPTVEWAWSIVKNASDQIVLTVHEDDVLFDVLTHTTTLSAATWYHVHACVDFVANKLYLAIDGVLETANIVNATFVGWFGDTNIGARQNSGGTFIEFLDGNLEQVRFTYGFNRAGATVVLPTAAPPLYPIAYDLYGKNVYVNVTGDGTDATQDAIADVGRRAIDTTDLNIQSGLLQSITQVVFTDSTTSMEFDNDDTKWFQIPFPVGGLGDKWTIELYYYPNTTGNEEVLISNKQTGGTTGFELKRQTNDRLAVTLDGDNNIEAASQATVSGQWHHISVQSANGIVNVSQQGRNNIFGFGIPAPNLGTNPFYVGRRPVGVGSSNPANGFIGYVRITLGAWRYPYYFNNRKNTNLSGLIPPVNTVPVTTPATITLGSQTVLNLTNSTPEQLNQLLHNKDATETTITVAIDNLEDDNATVTLDTSILAI